jgi:hypothetical protein
MSVFKCGYENCWATLPSLMLGHLRLIHAQNATLRCCFCQKISSSSESFRKHIEREHYNELGREFQDLPSLDDDNNAGEVVSNVSLNNDDDGCNVDESMDVSKFFQIFSHQLTLFALQTREQHLLPKSTYNSIFSNMVSLFMTFHKHFSEVVLSHMESMGIDTASDMTLHNLLTDESLIENVWSSFNSDAKINRFCKDNLSLVESVEAVLGTNDAGKKESYQYIPVCKTLEKYLSHTDVWASVNRLKVNGSDKLVDYTDGIIFKESAFWSAHSNALRLHFYIDDLELCNPLGSAKKKHSITAVYFQVGNIEQKYLSSLRSIHVACICNSALAKKYGLNVILKEIIEDVKVLQTTGINLSVEGQSHLRLGSIATVSADNLASHEIGGFRRCFSSGKLCRSCMVSYDVMKQFVSETDTNFPNLRSSANHKVHVDSVKQNKSLCRTYGVEKESALSALDTFCPITCLPPDCMHDVLEGVIPIVLKVCIRGCIQDGFFTLTVFNERLRNFKFGRNDAKNKPTLLPASFPTSSIPGSASQKWCMFRFLSFIVGDLVPEGNKFWDLYLLCQQLVHIVFCS